MTTKSFYEFVSALTLLWFDIKLNDIFEADIHEMLQFIMSMNFKNI